MLRNAPGDGSSPLHSGAPSGLEHPDIIHDRAAADTEIELRLGPKKLIPYPPLCYKGP